MKTQKKNLHSTYNFSPFEQRRIFLNTLPSSVPQNTEYSVDMYSQKKSNEKNKSNEEKSKVKQKAEADLAKLKESVKNGSVAYKVKHAKTLYEAFQYIDGSEGPNNAASREAFFLANANQIGEYARKKLRNPNFNTKKYTKTASQNLVFLKWIKEVLLAQESYDTQFNKSVSHRRPTNKPHLSNGKEFSGNAAKLVATACQFAHDKGLDGKSRIPYKWGGTDLTKGVDCSGFTQALCKEQGVNIPRVARNQAKYGKRVEVSGFPGGDFSGLVPGDLLFFNHGGKSRVSHVAIYSGNGRMVDARSTKIGIVETPIPPYYQDRFVTARRYIA